MGFYLDAKFDSFFEYREAVRRWSLEHTLLSAGGFYGTIAVMDFGIVQLVKTSLGGVIEHRGLTPEGYRTFSLPCNIKQPWYWYNKPVDTNYIASFPLHGDIDSITYKNFSFITLSIEEEHWETMLRNCNAIHLYKTLPRHESIFDVTRPVLFYLKNYIQHLFERINMDPALREAPGFIHNVTVKVPSLLINYLDKQRLLELPEFNRKRDIAFQSTVDYVARNLKRNISVKELCMNSSASLRSLEMAFAERYNISPKAYIKAARLNQLRWELQHAPKTRSIAEIAQEYGFHHLGQLSQDYKKLFGELPKETRKAVRVEQSML